MDEKNALSKSYYSKEEFERAFEREKAKYPYTPLLHKGRRNPYTGTKVENAEDYYSYLRLYVQRRLLEQSLEKEYKQKASGLEISSKAEIQRIKKDYETHIKTLENSLSTTKYTLRKLEDEQFKRRMKRLAVRLFIYFIVGSILFTGWFPYRIEEESEAAYSSGYDIGYEEGQEETARSAYGEGYELGYDEGAREAYNDGYDAGVSHAEKEAELQQKQSAAFGNSQSTTAGAPPVTPSNPQSGVVYISASGGKIHKRSDCSGMKNYFEMQYDAAVAAGYEHCGKCY